MPTAARTTASSANPPSSAVLNRRPATDRVMISSTVRSPTIGNSGSASFTVRRIVLNNVLGSPSVRTTYTIPRIIRSTIELSICAAGKYMPGSSGESRLAVLTVADTPTIVAHGLGDVGDPHFIRRPNGFTPGKY